MIACPKVYLNSDPSRIFLARSTYLYICRVMCVLTLTVFEYFFAGSFGVGLVIE